MKLTYGSSLEHLRELNSSFDTGVLQIAYHGFNRNGGHISKEAFEKSIETIWNCPIVCNYDRDTDSIGAHDVEIVKRNSSMSLVNVTQPVGVVPESSVPFWKTIEEDDGTTHEYLCVDILLWKRQEAYRKIFSDGIVAQSMEINVKDGELIDGVFHVKRFEFTAFCLLGSAEPCFESASLELFSRNGFEQQFSEMMADAKKLIIEIQSIEKTDVSKQNYSEGGDFALEEKNALMAEFNLTNEMIEFNLEDYTLEELRAKFEEMTSSHQEEPVVEPSVEPNTDHVSTYALADQVRDELMEAIRVEQVVTEFGSMSRYCFVDFDYESHEVYCYDSMDWKLYGMSYAVDGDAVKIDFESKKRKKYSIVDFVESEDADSVSVFASVFTAMNEQHAEVNKMLTEANEKVSAFSAELDELREFKLSASNSLNAYRVAEFREKFKDLAGIEEFEMLCENIGEHDLAEFEDKCFAIRGRNTVIAKFSHESKAPKLPVMQEQPKNENEPYGGLFQKFGIEI